ncbi:MAG TPA: hypothetical protein IAB22_09985 [Candidatus Merdivicinus intestinavium]|nr:hypothetical protein [Candidatus Merdivicinus intestinavium]
MTPIEFAQKYGLTVVSEGGGGCREIEGAYCCDLLSLVMGRAKENDAFVTVMANVNTIAVAVLADVACVILCEGIHFDAQSLARAKQQEVCVLESGESSFAVALKLGKELGLC